MKNSPKLSTASEFVANNLEKKFMPREVLSIHVGGGGCAIGEGLWNSLLHEISDSNAGGEIYSGISRDSLVPCTFYYESEDGKYSPRCVFADTDPSTGRYLKNIARLGAQSRCFRQDCRSNFFEGQSMASEYSIGESVVDLIREQAEKCDSLGGLLHFRSMGGGTGGGIGNEILRLIADEFPKKSVFDQVVYPSNDSSTSTVEPYNVIFALTGAIPLASLTLLFDNQAAFRICRSKLGVDNPSFSDMNGLIGRVISGATASLRNRSTLNASMDEIVMNLVPDPVFRYGIVSYFPFRNSRHSSNELVSSLFDPGSSLCDSPNSLHHRYFSASVLCGGTKPLPVVEIQRAVQKMKNNGSRIKFVPWIPNSFKVGLVETRSSVETSASNAVMLANSTAVNGLFVREYRKFLELFFHKAFVWQFLEAGGEMDDFYSARETIRDLIGNYTKIISDCETEESSALINRLSVCR